jgi:hypothetical protein
MPIDLVLSIGAGRNTVHVWNDARDRDYLLVVDSAASVAQVDPLNWILDQSYGESYGLGLISEALDTVIQYGDHADTVVAICNDPLATITYSVVAGSLPAGLYLDPTSGAIGGRAFTTGGSSVTIRASASGYAWSTRAFAITVAAALYMPGDQTADGILDILDIVGLVDYVFRGKSAPVPLNAGGPTGDCAADVSDVVALVDHVFRAGRVPMLGCLE